MIRGTYLPPKSKSWGWWCSSALLSMHEVLAFIPNTQALHKTERQGDQKFTASLATQWVPDQPGLRETMEQKLRSPELGRLSLTDESPATLEWAATSTSRVRCHRPGHRRERLKLQAVESPPPMLLLPEPPPATADHVLQEREREREEDQIEVRATGHSHKLQEHCGGGSKAKGIPKQDTYHRI